MYVLRFRIVERITVRAFIVGLAQLKALQCEYGKSARLRDVKAKLIGLLLVIAAEIQAQV